MKYLDTLKGLNIIQNKKEVLKHLFNISSKKVIKYKLKSNIKFLVPNLKKHRSTILSINEIFREEIYPIKRSQEERIILDIGAQAGIFSIYCLSKNKKTTVFSFEPDPENFIQLRKNITINNLEKQIIPINKALAGKNGKIEFYIHPTSSRANSIYEKNGEKIVVDAHTLEKIFEKFKIKKCDILKIDIEGAEYESLYNCPKKILDKIEIIFIECHDIKSNNSSYNIKGMIKFLTKNDFKISNHNPGILIAKKKK